MLIIHGKNYRFILANTEELHSKIAEMSDRIQQLEDAVATMQPSLSSEPHPLLHPDLLRIKSSAELHRAQMTGSTKSAPSPPDEHSEGEPSRNLTPSALPQEHAYDFRAAPDVSTTLSPKFRPELTPLRSLDWPNNFKDIAWRWPSRSTCGYHRPEPSLPCAMANQHTHDKAITRLASSKATGRAAMRAGPANLLVAVSVALSWRPHLTLTL